jgi:hypothetical protein
MHCGTGQRVSSSFLLEYITFFRGFWYVAAYMELAVAFSECEIQIYSMNASNFEDGNHWPWKSIMQNKTAQRAIVVNSLNPVVFLCTAG